MPSGNPQPPRGYRVMEERFAMAGDPRWQQGLAEETSMGMSKVRTILDAGWKTTTDPQFVRFLPRTDEDPTADAPNPVAAVEMPVDMWAEFGHPGTVTVTVEPGDLLNV